MKVASSFEEVRVSRISIGNNLSKRTTLYKQLLNLNIKTEISESMIKS